MFSDNIKLEVGVPQGSVLVPLLFCIYLIPLRDILNEIDVDYHIYADDRTLCFTIDNFEAGTMKAQQVVYRVQEWFSSMNLKMKEPSSCFSVQEEVESQFLIKLFWRTSTSTWRLTSVVLVLFSTSFFTFEKQFKLVCASCHYQLGRILSLSRPLGFDFTRSLVISLVLSRLDYCNSLYSGLPSFLLNKLQRVQNRCARLLFKLNRRVDVTPYLHYLHWLTVGARIKFKVLMFMYRLFNADNYLSDLFYSSQLSVRSFLQRLFSFL